MRRTDDFREEEIKTSYKDYGPRISKIEEWQRVHNIVRSIPQNTTFDKDAEKPQFKECAKHPHIDEKGYVLYYTSQCPFNAKYVPILERTAKENDIPFRAIHIESREEAQSAPTPITNYALFHDGEYVTNEQMNDKKFLKLINR